MNLLALREKTVLWISFNEEDCQQACLDRVAFLIVYYRLLHRHQS